MINLTAQLDTNEINRKMREVYANAKQMTSGVATESEKMDMAMMRFKNTLFSTAAQIGGGIGLIQLARQIATTRGEFQQLEVAFTTLLQSKAKADALMAEAVELAAKTPFSLQGVATGARQLIAYGFAAEDITDTLTRLGNVASGLGLPMERLTYLFGTTMTQGRLYARDLIQFTTSGIPLLQELADMYGVNTDEVNKMVTAGKVGFEDVRKVFENMTNSGGKFYNLMQEQSKTITGRISNLKDAISVMFNETGKSQEGAINSAISGAAYLVENYETVLDILAQLVVAYGTYKAAIILLAATEKLRYQATLAHMSGLTTLQAMTELLTAKTKALNKAMLSNPYILAAAAAAALAVIIYRLVTAKSAEEQAIENVNNAIDEYNNKQDELKSKAEESIRIMNDEVSTVYGKQKAYEDLVATYPELLKQYTEEQIKMMMLTEAGKELMKILSKIRGERDATNLQEGFDAALEKVRKLKQEVGSYNAGAGMYSSSSMPNVLLEQAEADLEEWRDKMDKFRKTSASAAPVEVRVASLQKNIDDLTNQNAQIDKLIADAIKKRKEHPDLFIPYSESEGYFQGKKQSNLETIKSDTDKINSLQSGGDKDVVKNKAYWEGKKKEAEEAKEAIATSLKGTQKWKELEAQIAKYDSEIAKYDAKKTGKESLKIQKEIADAELKNQVAATKAKIDAMADGQAKELAQIQANRESAIAEIGKEEEELEEYYKKIGLKTPQGQKDRFESRRQGTAKSAELQSTEVEKKYAKEIEDLYAQIGSVWLTEEEKKRAETKKTYDAMREEAKRLLEGGKLPPEEYKTTLDNIQSAENEAGNKNLIADYKSYAEQRKEIETKFQTDIADMEAKNVDGKYTANIEEAKRQMKEALSSLDTGRLQKNMNLDAVFGNLDKVSTQTLTQARDSLKQYMETSKETLSPTDLKTLSDAYEQLNQKINDRKPGEALKKAFTDYKTANKELKQARKEEKDAKGTGTEKEAEAQAKVTKALDKRREAQMAVNEAIQGYAEKARGGLDAANAMTGALESFGVEIPESIKGALEGVGQMIGGLESIDVSKPLSIITGAFKMIGGLGKTIMSLFSGDNRKEREIGRLQGQVDSLQKSYDDLGESIEKAYSSDAKKLIESQNESLKKQNALIRAQIEEEESKKDSDNARIEEWQKKIEDNNKLIEENKEKAIDAIFGEDLKAAIENFASAYAEAWAKGEDKAESAKDTVRKMMRQMVTESIKAAIQSSGAMENIRKKLEEFYADRVLTGWEQNYIYNMADSLQKELDRQFGWADSLMKDEASKSTSQQATSRGFQAMSQDTGSELNGRFTDIQGKVTAISASLELIKGSNIEQRNIMLDYRDIFIQMNGNLGDIRNFVKPISEIRDIATQVNKKLEKL